MARASKYDNICAQSYGGRYRNRNVTGASADGITLLLRNELGGRLNST